MNRIFASCIPFNTLLCAAASLSLVGATCNQQAKEKARKQSYIHMELAQNHLKENDLVSARREGVLAVEADPTNPDAHYTLAYIFGQLRDWDNALKHAKAAIKTAGHHPEAENLHGVILIQMGRNKEAIEVLEKLTADFLYSTPHLAYGNLGLAYYNEGRYDEALGALKKAVQLQPLFCVGFYRLGLVYAAMKRYKDALEALDRCVTIDDPWGECKRFQDAYSLIGNIRSELGVLEAAASAYEKCIEINQNNAVGIECKKRLTKLKANH